MARYQWRMTTNYMSDTSLSFGVSPSTWQDWQDDQTGDKDGGTVTYFYRDANVSSGGAYTDANSSRVVISTTQSWTTSVDSRNNLTVTLRTTINSIVRDDLRGANQNTPGRDIRVYRNVGGPQLLSLTDTQLAVAHTIYNGPLVIEERTFTLSPGSDATGGQLQVYNQVIGGESFDDIRVGVQFKNVLPNDYRPGATLDTNTSTWKSHNRTNGACHVLSNVNNMIWLECRTLGGNTGAQGNPPLILHAANANSWYNQKKLGRES